MKKHREYLNNMCRVCTRRTQTSQDIIRRKPATFACKFKDNIYSLCGIDINTDNENVHPQKLCRSCVDMITNSKRTGSNGEMNLSGIYGEQKEKCSKTNSFWDTP